MKRKDSVTLTQKVQQRLRVVSEVQAGHRSVIHETLEGSPDDRGKRAHCKDNQQPNTESEDGCAEDTTLVDTSLFGDDLRMRAQAGKFIQALAEATNAAEPSNREGITLKSGREKEGDYSGKQASLQAVAARFRSALLGADFSLAVAGRGGRTKYLLLSRKGAVTPRQVYANLALRPSARGRFVMSSSCKKFDGSQPLAGLIRLYIAKTERINGWTLPHSGRVVRVVNGERKATDKSDFRSCPEDWMGSDFAGKLKLYRPVRVRFPW